MRYLLSAATIALSTGLTGFGAANAQSLGDAVRDALDDGCQGFLSPGEFNVTDDIVNVGPELIDRAGRRVFEVDSNALDPNDPPDVVPPGVLYLQNWTEDQLIPILDAGGRLIGYNLDFRGDLLFERADGGAPDVLNLIRIDTDVSQVVDVSEIRAPNAGLLGAGLAQYCTVNGEATQQTLTRTVSSHFFFNADNGIKVGSGSAGLFGSANALTAFSSAIGAGAGANRSQESVVRRERGLASLIERLRRRAERWREASMQVASLDDTIMPRERSFAVVLDASGGVVNLDRDATALEGAFSADSTIANFGAAVALRNNMIFGGALTFENTDSTVTGSPAGQTDFENEVLTGAAFVGWSSPPVSIGFEQPANIVLTASASHGNGDQSYNRSFSATYQPDLDSPAAVTNTDRLSGSVDQNVTTLSFQATAAQPLGAFTFTPHASIAYVQFETGGYAETTDGADDGLALRYADVEDEWIEGRIGAGLAYAIAMGDDSAIEFSGNVDAVFIGDAETPLRTAFFVQDLRASPFAITYQVDGLDDQYFDLSGSVAFQLSNGLTPYITAFTRAGHEYLQSDGLFLGLRYSF